MTRRTLLGALCALCLSLSSSATAAGGKVKDDIDLPHYNFGTLVVSTFEWWDMNAQLGQEANCSMVLETFRPGGWDFHSADCVVDHSVSGKRELSLGAEGWPQRNYLTVWRLTTDLSWSDGQGGYIHREKVIYFTTGPSEN